MVLAVHQHTGKEFAVKIYRLKDDSRLADQIQNEIRLLNLLHGHPNILQLRNSSGTEDFYYLITEVRRIHYFLDNFDIES